MNWLDNIIPELKIYGPTMITNITNIANMTVTNTTLPINSNNKTNKQNIVLDLDETLVQIIDEHEITREEFINRQNKCSIQQRNHFFSFEVDNIDRDWGSGTVEFFYGIVRPNVTPFLNYCFNRFDKVVVWSAGYSRYVEAGVSHVFRNTQMPNYIFARPFCKKIKNKQEITNKSDSDEFDPKNEDETFYNGITFTKPLIRLQSYDPTFTLENTFLLDNSVLVANENPNNLIHISDFRPWTLINNKMLQPVSHMTQTIDTDSAFIQLMNWFDKPEVIDCKDIRTLNKTNIFS
jgi:hypothetical protein